MSNSQSKPTLKKDARLNECSGGDVGCYSWRRDIDGFIRDLTKDLSTKTKSQNILIVGHSRKGYELMKNGLLRDSFWDVRKSAVDSYVKNCRKSGRWYSCESKRDSSVIYREYSHVHNALPISFEWSP